MLKIEPVRSYRSPDYPDKRVVLENPDILKTLPQRWKGKVYAGFAFSSVVVLLLSGCQQQATAGVPAPPAYLTEEEACSIIIEEAEKYGVEFDKTGLELQDVKFYIDRNTSEASAIVEHTQDIELDGYDKEKKIGFEFASSDDVQSLAKNIEGLTEDEILYFTDADYKEELEEALGYLDEKIYFQTFYSASYPDIADTKAELQEQVESFMEWLKSEGVI
ncbi:MAG: hypothetical protein K0R84_39 [Clostridia bacterium]|jgi:hypothetical protein|nr:hypothetical protein [Clostridia bacterium]